MRTWDSRSRPEPKGLLGRRARRATPRIFPWSRVKKLTIKSASRKGYVRRTNVSLTRAGIELVQRTRLARVEKLRPSGGAGCQQLPTCGGLPVGLVELQC